MRRSITGRTHLARINELVDLVETGEVVPRLSRGRRQGAITGQLDTPGDIAEGNKPVSFTRHRLFSHASQAKSQRLERDASSSSRALR